MLSVLAPISSDLLIGQLTKESRISGTGRGSGIHSATRIHRRRLGMLSRRACVLANAVHRASRACLLGSCKCCASRVLATGLRGLATRTARVESTLVETRRPSPANMCPAEEFDISRLAKPLDAELQHNARLIKEERLNMDRVNEDHARLLRENSVSVIFRCPGDSSAESVVAAG